MNNREKLRRQDRQVTLFFLGLILIVTLFVLLDQHELPAPSLRIGLNMCGKGMWIKYLGNCERGNIDEMIAKANRAGLNFVIIKTHDGDAVYPFRGRRVERDKGEPLNQWLGKTGLKREMVAKFHQAGIAVFAWGYCYGRNVNEEVLLIKYSLNELNCDGYVFDVEKEMKGDAEVAAQLCSQVGGYLEKHHPNKLLAYSSYANPAGHGGFPYRVFNQYCQRTLPQTYWSFGKKGVRSPAKVVTRFFSQWLAMQNEWRREGKPELVIPAVPTGQCHRGTPAAEVAEFAQLTRNYHGRAYWLWDQCGPKQWQAIKNSKVHPFDPVALASETNRPVIQ